MLTCIIIKFIGRPFVQFLYEWTTYKRLFIGRPLVHEKKTDTYKKKTPHHYCAHRCSGGGAGSSHGAAAAARRVP
jgi:hypothetical protein